MGERVVIGLVGFAVTYLVLKFFGVFIAAAVVGLVLAINHK